MEVFEIISLIEDVEIIAVGGGIRDVERLRKTYGSGRWRKLKGRAFVRLEDGCDAKPNFIGMKHTALVEEK